MNEETGYRPGPEILNFGPSGTENMLSDMFHERVSLYVNDGEYLEKLAAFERDVLNVSKKLRALFPQVLTDRLHSLSAPGEDIARARARVNDLLIKYPNTPVEPMSEEVRKSA